MVHSLGAGICLNFFLFGKVACEEASKRHPDFQFLETGTKQEELIFSFAGWF